MEKIFTLPDVWHGGFFELGILLESHSEEYFQRLLQSLWTHTALAGCYAESGVEPNDQGRLDPGTITFPSEGHLYGIATLPNQIRVACGTCILLSLDEKAEWVNFYIPMGALGLAYKVGAYPFEDGTSLEWRQPVSDWFYQIASKVFDEVGFRFGVVGHEASGDDSSREFKKNGIPEERWSGYLCREGDKLGWYPPNKMAPYAVTP